MKANSKGISIFLAVILTFGLVSCAKNETVVIPELETLSERETPVEWSDGGRRQELVVMTEAFSHLSDTNGSLFTTLSVEGGVAITGYSGTEACVKVPEKLGGQEVVKISVTAFSEHAEITTLFLPDTVKIVETSALKDLSALKSLRTPICFSCFGELFGAESYLDNPLKVPGTLQYLGLGKGSEISAYSFYDCNDLIAVGNLPEIVSEFSFANCDKLEYADLENVKSLGDYAFANCSSLEEVVFTEKTEAIGLSAFEGCTVMRKITLPFVGASNDGEGYLSYIFGAKSPEFSKGYYPMGLQKVTVLSGCRKLSENAFYQCESVYWVELSEGLEEIGMRAFAGCKNLEKIQIPDSVTTIRENAFSDCIYLKSIGFTERSALKTVGINAFYNCQSLLSVTVPSGVTEIPNSCFADCRKLQTVDLNRVQTVGTNAFYHCISLVEVKGEAPTFSSGNDIAKWVMGVK